MKDFNIRINNEYETTEVKPEINVVKDPGSGSRILSKNSGTRSQRSSERLISGKRSPIPEEEIQRNIRKLKAEKVTSRKRVVKKASSKRRDKSSSSRSSTSRSESRERYRPSRRKTPEKVKRTIETQETDEEIRRAISAAIIETKSDSIRQAKDEGHELRAKFLESMPRIGELSDAIESATRSRRRTLRRAAVEASEEKVKMSVDDGNPKKEKDLLGNVEDTKDPLGLDEDPPEQEIEKDDIYEESSDDDDKATLAEKKDDMIYRFRCLKEDRPGLALPRITKNMKLGKMVRLYEHVMDRLKLRVKTGNYKIFLTLGLMAMEFLGKKFGMGAYCSGFAINQMYSLKRYEKLLRELGQSDFSSIGANMPVSLRLLFYMGLNYGIFVVAKFVFGKTGKDYTEEFHKIYNQLIGGDDFKYLVDAGKGMDEDPGVGEEGGGILGLMKTFMGLLGGGGGGPKKKRGETAGPTYKRRKD